jgi:ribosomal protein L24
MAKLKAGHRVNITGGKYNGKDGTIIKINNVRHQVEVDSIGLGWVTRTYCTRILEQKETTPRHHDSNQNTSRLSTISPHTNRPSSIIVPNVSDASTAGNTSVELRHGPEVTTQVLMDLLAKSIATMHISETTHMSDDQIDEWTRQLRTQIIHFRHDYN